MRLRPAEYYLTRLRKISRAHGGALLSCAYAGDNRKLRFRCAEGHEWSQAPGAVYAGRWCAKCGIARAAETRRAPARARFFRLVARRGGVVLSPEYVNSQTHLRFRCVEGHEWSAVPNAISMGQWCPACGWKNRMKHHAERKRRVFSRLRAIVKKHGGKILPPGFIHSHAPLNFRCARGHTWNARAQSIDGGVWCPRCKEESLLAEFRAVAERWGGECLSHRCRTGYDRLVWRCARGHRWQAIANQIKRRSWCPKCRSAGPGNIGRMRQIASERSGECLSTRYVDAFTRLRWRCREGHEWSADPGTIVQGSWCPECRWHASYSRARLSIEIMREVAAERGGACLSPDYHGVHVRLKWRCARGHKWIALPTFIRQGKWCPVCSHSAPGTIEGMRALAVDRGGRCLTKTWNNHREPLSFECGRGHRFRALAGVVKSGVWCRICGR